MTFYQKLRFAAGEYAKTDLWLYATSGTYYLFFSLGPLAAIVLGLLPYLPFSQQELLETLWGYAPDYFRRMVQTLVSDVYAGSTAALGVGLAAELWSAGKFLGLLMRALCRIYDGEDRGGYLRRRLWGALYTALLVVLVLGNLVLLLWGERIAAAWGGPWLDVLLRLRWLLFLGAVTVINALLFRYVPRRELRFVRQLPGALGAAMCWLAFSQVYSWAVDRFSFFSVYGGLAIVFISLFWIYCSLFLLFLGAWANALREGPPAQKAPSA